ncbi:MAG: ATP synthase F1 subunit gamma [Vicinamibacteraceae bacterium]|nr:ATP synthase F1 subunit gamma [Vicinamibacteraceae bacterium]
MPSLIDLRRRIRAVKNTQQITKAMKMIAASRLRKAQDRMLHARPMALQMRRVLGSLAARVDPTVHPLLADRDLSRPDAKTLLIVVTADKGLCGAFNTNVLKEASRVVGEARQPLVLGLVGSKGRDFFRRRGFQAVFEKVHLASDFDFADAAAIAVIAMEEFTSGRVDRVQILYNEFKSVLQQRIVVEQLLPITTETGVLAEAEPGAPTIEYLYEPDPQRIFDELLPWHVRFQVYHALLESLAAEQAARMTAMDSATRNSAEVIDSLTLYMNKVRQANITREIIEVVSGAQAL